MKKCVIFAAGEYGADRPHIPENSFIIAADAGFNKAREYGVAPDIILGDFDSLGVLPQGDNVRALPCEKDITDTLAAAEEGLRHGCGEFYIYGGTGGRPDHTFANYSLIADLSRKRKKAYLKGADYDITAITDESLVLYGEKGKKVSVFSFGNTAEGVSLEGLKYPLDSETLTDGFALGVSNEHTTGRAQISVKRGTLLIMFEK